MIPSRSLALVEIISETFSIYGRCFARYALFFVLLFVPGLYIVTAGTTNFVHDAITAARRDIHFDDSGLTTLRNDMKALLPKQKLLPAAETAADEYPHPPTKQVSDYLQTNISHFGDSIELLAVGLVLFVIGIFALAACTVDLACQAFEERELEFWGSLRTSFAKHVWKILLLYLLYLFASWAVDGILAALPGQVGAALSGLVMIGEIYIVIRLTVTVPALVSEELGPFQALARSWQLTRRAGWRIFGASFVFGAILFLGFILLSLVMGLVFNNSFTLWSDFLTRDHLTIDWLLQGLPGFLRAAAIGSSIAGLLLFGLLPIFGTVLYYDLRTRHDGPMVYVDDLAK